MERPPEEEIDEALEEGGGRHLVHEEHAVMDRAHEGLEEDLVVLVRRELAARDRGGDHRLRDGLAVAAQLAPERGDPRRQEPSATSMRTTLWPWGELQSSTMTRPIERRSLRSAPVSGG